MNREVVITMPKRKSATLGNFVLGEDQLGDRGKIRLRLKLDRKTS